MLQVMSVPRAGADCWSILCYACVPGTGLHSAYSKLRLHAPALHSMSDELHPQIAFPVCCVLWSYGQWHSHDGGQGFSLQRKAGVQATVAPHLLLQDTSKCLPCCVPWIWQWHSHDHGQGILFAAQGRRLRYSCPTPAAAGHLRAACLILPQWPTPVLHACSGGLGVQQCSFPVS